MSRTIGIIQARMGSERLPGKILAPLAGRPLLDRLFLRIASSRVDEWWLATSSHPSDDVTEAWGFELGIRVFRGHETDILSRFVAIGTEAAADWIIRVCADNPFLDAALIDTLLEARDASLEAKEADLIRHGRRPRPHDEELAATSSDARSPVLPLGYAVELIRREALERAAREVPADQRHHRVHVTSWLDQHGRIYDAPAPANWPERPNWRWTVDTYQDLAMTRSAFRLFGGDATTIDYSAIVACLDEHPEITSMNTHIEEKPLDEG